MNRVRRKLDELQGAGDERGAARLLEYWLAEARQASDSVGETLVENEFVGFFRKAGRGEEALAHADRAVSLLGEYGLEDTIMAGTTRINAATACTAFGLPEKAMLLFREARTIYENLLTEEDSRLGGLYNNMGLCAMRLSRYDEARRLFEKALAAVRRIPGNEAEQAVTLLNMADLVNEEAGGGDEDALIAAAEETERLCDEAWNLLDSPSLPRDEDYRFYCSKCAPVFGHYGYLDRERQLLARAGI